MDGYLLRHCHNVLVRHLPGCYPSINHVKGSLIFAHIGEVAVELIRDQEEKERVWEQAENKAAPKFLGTNLT